MSSVSLKIEFTSSEEEEEEEEEGDVSSVNKGEINGAVDPLFVEQHIDCFYPGRAGSPSNLVFHVHTNSPGNT